MQTVSCKMSAIPGCHLLIEDVCEDHKIGFGDDENASRIPLIYAYFGGRGALKLHMLIFGIKETLKAFIPCITCPL